ncbi:NmrA/HSCARG family protein [Arthrobacter sp. HLT1-21]
MNSPGIIAVYGATGQQGGAVINALLDQGASVRALVRNPSSDKAHALHERGVELVQVDADAPSTLVSALQGVQALFFMSAPPGGMQTEDTVGETRQGLAVADAAHTAQVPHVLFSSVGGAERHSGIPHFESKRRIEEHLEELGLPVTFIRPVFFMDNLHYMAPSVESGELVLRLPLPDGVPLQMVAARDVGIIAATALMNPAAIAGNAIEIAGDQRTGSELANAYAEHTGLPARYEALPLSVLGGQHDMQAMFGWFAETPAYQADLYQVRTIHPAVLDFPDWLKSINYQPPV